MRTVLLSGLAGVAKNGTDCRLRVLAPLFTYLAMAPGSSHGGLDNGKLSRYSIEDRYIDHQYVEPQHKW